MHRCPYYTMKVSHSSGTLSALIKWSGSPYNGWASFPSHCRGIIGDITLTPGDLLAVNRLRFHRICGAKMAVTCSLIYFKISRGRKDHDQVAEDQNLLLRLQTPKKQTTDNLMQNQRCAECNTPVWCSFMGCK